MYRAFFIFILFFLLFSKDHAFSLEELPTEVYSHLCLFFSEGCEEPEESIKALKLTSKKINQKLNKDLVRKTLWKNQIYSKYQVLKTYADFTIGMEKGLCRGNFILSMKKTQDLVAFFEDKNAQSCTQKLTFTPGDWQNELDTDFFKRNLSHFANLKSFRFANFTEISDSLFEKIILSFPYPSQIEELHLYPSSALSPDFSDKLLSFFPSLHSLKSLSLHILTSSKGNKEIATGFFSLKKLVSFTFRCCGLSLRDIIFLKSPFLNPNFLRVLNLPYIIATPEQARTYLPFFLSFPNIEELGSHHMVLTGEILIILLPIFENLKNTLKKLNLSNCFINAKGIQILTPVFKNFSRLQFLDLSYNELNHESGPFLAEFLPHLIHLHTLNLSYNLVLFDIHDHLAPALSPLHNLKKLFLCCPKTCYFTKQLMALGKLIKEDLPKLRHLAICGFNYTYLKEDFLFFSQALYQAPELKFLTSRNGYTKKLDRKKFKHKITFLDFVH